MGVHQLWSILQPATTVQPLEAIASQRVVVDISCWIVECSGRRLPGVHHRWQPHLHLAGLFHRLRTLLALNCTIACVADGDFDPLKRPTVTARLQGPLTQQQQDRANAVRYAGGAASKRPQHSHFGRMVQEGMRLCKAMGIPCIRSPLDAEAQCAVLNAAGLFDACITSDSDAFLFGATHVYRSLKLDSQSGCEGVLEVCTLQAIEGKLGFGRNSLIALGVFLGSDYHEGIKGIGVQRASRLVTELGERHVLEALLKDGVQAVLSGSSSRRKPKKGAPAVERDDGQPSCNDDAIAAVVAAFLEPVVHGPSSDVVVSALKGSHEVDLDSLVSLMQQYLDWDEDKTQSFILPKLAERGLRRRADDLCRGLSASAEISASTPIQYIPRTIIKARTAKHVRCFEVSWQGSPPLANTAVPAVLLGRAYPDLVRRFQEEEAAKKRSKRKAPKSCDKAGLETVLCPAEARAIKPLCENLKAVDLREAEVGFTPSGCSRDWRPEESEVAGVWSPQIDEREDACTDDEIEAWTILSEGLSRAKDGRGLLGRDTMREEVESLDRNDGSKRCEDGVSGNGRKEGGLASKEGAARVPSGHGCEARTNRGRSYLTAEVVSLDLDDEDESSDVQRACEVGGDPLRLFGTGEEMQKNDFSRGKAEEKLRLSCGERVASARPLVSLAKQKAVLRGSKVNSRSPQKQAQQERSLVAPSIKSPPPSSSSPEAGGGTSIKSIMASIKLGQHRPAPTLSMGT